MASSGALMRNEVLLTALSRKLKETCRVIVHYMSRSSGNIPELKPHDRTTRVVNVNSQAIIYSTQLTEKSAAPFLLFLERVVVYECIVIVKVKLDSQEETWT